MITYKQIPIQTVELWSPTGDYYVVNEHELYDIRLQIMNESVEGWYVMFNHHKIDINSKGQLSEWPKGFFDLTDYYLDKLLTPSW